MKNTLNKYLIKVEKPARYTGGEYNTPDMTKLCNVRFCLCFTDIYEVGMSNLGVSILYDLVNKMDNIICERCFAPWLDMGEILIKEKIPLMSLETKRPLNEFDVIGFSVSYEMSYTNILYMLDLAQIPFRAKGRENFPIIIGGGPISANPEPIIDFFDAFCIGEGEESLKEFLLVAEKHKGDKDRILLEASKIEGIYVPSHCEVVDGKVITKIKKASVCDLDKASFPLKPLVPNIEIVHDRSVIELYRGCYAGCRFCQACFFYRPIRYRESDTVVGIVSNLIKNTGYDEVGLSSLSTGDYESINAVICDLKAITDRENVELQMPSLRLDSFTAELMSGSGKRKSLTFAPEAGSQRLRNVINKNITEQDIDSSMRLAFGVGYRTVKLYFMIGLPTETDEDIMGIVDIVNRIRNIYNEVTNKRDININVSTATFIPKPVTPFQWVAQISIEEMYRKQNMLKKELFAIKGVRYSWHGAEISVIEGIFARGERNLSYLIEKAYSLGCCFDSWGEKFDNDKWLQAIKECQIDIESHTRQRNIKQALSWDFIDFGVTKEYLIKEYQKALKGEITPPCKYNCNGCGANCNIPCRQFNNTTEANN